MYLFFTIKVASYNASLCLNLSPTQRSLTCCLLLFPEQETCTCSDTWLTRHCENKLVQVDLLELSRSLIMNNCTFYTIDCCFKTNKNVKQLGHQVIFVTYPVPFLILGKLKPYSDVEAPFRIKIYQYLHNNIACMLQFINHQNFIYTRMRDQYHS